MLSLRALVVTAAGVAAALALAVTATFAAPAPGADLEPRAGADQLVAILQGSRSLVWTSLVGPVSSYRVEGWPVHIDGNELGGAVMIERPADGTAGTIWTGDKPRTITFSLDG